MQLKGTKGKLRIVNAKAKRTEAKVVNLKQANKMAAHEARSAKKALKSIKHKAHKKIAKVKKV